MTKTRIAREIGIWLLTLLLVAMFAAAGVRKFSDRGLWADFFRRAHFADWFRILIGAVEVGAAALLVLPRTAAYGAVSVIVVMIGAIVTVVMVPVRHFTIIQPSIALILAAIVLAARWQQRILKPS
jgi:putative oxidoreductase